MKKEYGYDLTEINKFSISELSTVASVSKDMVRKYKNGKNLPRLDTAVLFEDTFGIPVRAWIELKTNKQVG